jgi:amino acid transporter
VNRKHGTPGPAIWAIVAASLVVMMWSGAVPIVTSLSTVALYISYIVPIIFAAKSRLAGSNWPAMSVWSLGRWGLPMNVIAISYTVVISVVLIMPPNELAAKTLGGVLAVLAAIYLFEVRHKYKSPEWAREQAANNGAAGV